MTIKLPWASESDNDSSLVEGWARGGADELVVASELLDPQESLRFLRELIATLRLEEATLAEFLGNKGGKRRLI